VLVLKSSQSVGNVLFAFTPTQHLPSSSSIVIARGLAAVSTPTIGSPFLDASQ
jgi:hypothetical protein